VSHLALRHVILHCLACLFLALEVLTLVLLLGCHFFHVALIEVFLVESVLIHQVFMVQSLLVLVIALETLAPIITKFSKVWLQLVTCKVVEGLAQSLRSLINVMQLLKVLFEGFVGINVTSLFLLFFFIQGSLLLIIIIIFFVLLLHNDLILLLL